MVSLVSPIRRVDELVSMTSLEVLGRCLIGQCRHPISNSDLATTLRAEKFEGVRVLRMSGSSVLLIFDNIENRRQVKEREVLSTWFDRVSEWCEDDSYFENRRVWVSIFGVPVHAWTSETFERVVAQWGTVIRVAEEIMVHSSFEKGRMLIETSTMDRIDDRLELCVNDKVFPVRITEVDTFLRGSRLGCDCPVSDCESQSTNEEERNLPDVDDHMVDEVQDHVEVTVAKDGAECASLIREEEVRPSGGVEARSHGHLEEVSWRGNALWEVVPAAHPPLQPVLDTDLDLVSVPIEEGVIEGLTSNVIGLEVEGSKAEVIHFKGSRRKVRMLAYVIQSVSTPAEREERKKGSKGRGRQRPVFGSSGVAGISLSDSDF
ncbi:hypothetical protein V6N11_044795 [Hibiscus sabdariffa]|uniref:DUF4283 domain-containing protein n=1 Tax=Hibiscus sabdariffa TaxID=183260 RepID=A0ABR2PTZ0_9ROSI